MRIAIAALLLALVPAGAASAAPAADPFYDPPSPLPQGPHGTLIRSAPYAGTGSVEGATNTRFLYKQRGIADRPVATSGFVVVPTGDAPAGGWPVVAWAHGTTGLADRCAPTRFLNPEDDAKHGALMRRWVELGYAVARTDYEGLGTPGRHPYLDGVSAGRSVLDAVRAARRLEPSLGSTVVMAGHSQGGHAALWAAALAPTYTPGLDVRGTVAMAPPSQLRTIVQVLRSTGILGGPSASLAYFLYGAQVADPTLRAKRRVLSAQARRIWPQLHRRCKSQLAAADSFGSLPSSRVIAEEAHLGRLLTALDASDPRELDLDSPVLLLQGTSDTTVLRAWTDALAEQLSARGASVDYRTYPGATHATVAEAGAEDATAFVTAAFG